MAKLRRLRLHYFANFANPSSNFGAGPTVFGVINSVGQPINAGGDPQPGRAIQLAGKFYF